MTIDFREPVWMPMACLVRDPLTTAAVSALTC
jgi:hypothetical protein